jgi:putative oxidoreductase
LEPQTANWKTPALILARVIMAAMFALACTFKFSGMAATATYISMAGFPAATVLAWLAAFFELALVLCFLTGAYFREACLLAAAYVVFLAFAFHGTSTWTDNEGLHIGAFVSHFPFAAGLLFGAVNGPGHRWVLAKSFLK